MIEHDEVRVVQRIGGSGGRGRGPTLVWGFVAVLVAVVAFGIAGRQEPVQPGDGQAAAGSGSPPASQTRTPRPTHTPRPPTPAPYLPPIPNMDLAGAPPLVLARRAGDDLELRSWQPGQAGFEVRESIAGAFAGVPGDASTWVDLSPDLTFGAIAVEEWDANGNRTSARVRIVGSGREPWESADLPYGPQVLWSPDGARLVIGGGPEWILVQLGPAGQTSVAGVPVAAEPVPPPSLSPSPDPQEPGSSMPRHPVPFAFSADGRSLYGATVHDTRPTYRPAIRVAVDALGAGPAAVTAIDRLPVGGPDGFAPTGYPAETADPLTGRTIEIMYDGTAPQLAIYGPGGETSIEVDGLSGEIVAAHWAGDGRLLATLVDPLDRQVSVEVRWIEADGTVGPVVLSAERVNGGGPWLSRPGWVLFGFQAGEAVLLALLRTSDGATATVELGQDDWLDMVALDFVDTQPTSRRGAVP